MTVLTTLASAARDTASLAGPFGTLLLLMPAVLLLAGLLLAERPGSIRWISIVRGPIPAPAGPPARHYPTAAGASRDVAAGRWPA